LSIQGSDVKSKEKIIHIKLDDIKEKKSEVIDKKTRVWNLNNMRETVKDPL
jgi:hypothetical protein